MKRVLVLYVGCSGSGKSTAAKLLVKEGLVEINRDYFRFKLFCDGVEDWSKYKFTKQREQEVTKACEVRWKLSVEHLKSVVVSNTNLNQKDHDYWKAKAEEAGYEFNVVYFPETLETLFKRDEKRGTLSVGRETLIQQWQKWLKITNARKYVPNLDKPITIVSDIDGSIAKMSGRSPYEWAKVGEDQPRTKIINMIEALYQSDQYELVFVSGRDGSCYPETYAWLIKNVGLPFKLYMREAGDQRKDTIVKEEILFNHLEPNYNIEYWFDDRPCVVRSMKLLGVNVIDVSEGINEF